MIKSPSTRIRSIYIAAGSILLLCGYCLYLAYRVPGGTALHAWSVSQFLMRIVPHSMAHAPWMDWMPSFIYVLAFSLICEGVFGARTRFRYAVPIFWMLVAAVFEAGQYFHFPVKQLVPASWIGALPVHYLDSYFRFGTYDPLDIAVGFCGMLIAILASALMRGGRAAPVAKKRAIVPYLRKAVGFAVFLLGIVCLLASSSVYEYSCDYEPVYLSYDDLRKPISAAAPEALSQNGKIYVYGNLILFNDRNRGIHMIDNANPVAPVNLAFLPIPGNIDIAVKDNILYADSYIDLVAIDISDLNNIHEVNRKQDIFPYDPYQVITGQNIYFCDYDETQGVVIGYTLKTR